MENENKDWKPEVGKTAWQLIGKTLRHVEIYGIDAMGPSNPNLAVFIRNAQGNLGATSMSAVGDYLFPTPEVALASIKIYDLEGKEVLIPRAEPFLIPPRPLVLEPKPLEWKKIDEGYFEAKDGAFTYQVDSSGFWSVDNVAYYPNTATDMDTAKAAIEKWRVNHLKSMLP